MWRATVLLSLALIRAAPGADPAAPADKRLGPPRLVSQGADFRPWADKAAWEQRVRYLREKTLVAAGLWPMPAKCPLNPVVTGTVDRGDYIVENVYFASRPGFYVTGSVFRPKGNGPFAGVLCAHGHAKLGRLEDPNAKGRDGKPLADPCPIQARCVGLARLGCVVLIYDMVGYAESRQVRHPSDAPKVRPAEGTDDFEGLEFEQYCLSTMGLQTWKSIRALDYLISRPDVDAKRLAITGSSGGATQTLMMMMADDRITAAAPVCMVSAGFQGDCVCEQAALGRIGTDTVEFCAAFAPKPLIVVGATGDWTKEIVEKGGPEIRAAYAAAGAADNVSVVRFEAPHNYNRTSREAVYAFFNKHLKLGKLEPIREAPFEPIPAEQLRVFTAAHPRPADALDAAGLKKALIREAEETMKRLRPTDAAKLAEFRRVVGTALKHMTGTELPAPGQAKAESLGAEEKDGVRVERLLLSRGGGEQVPALLLRPKTGGADTVLVVLPEGKAGFDDVTHRGMLKLLLDKGLSVLAIDPFLVGEYHLPGKPTPAPDAKTGFFACFNRTLLGQRVHDILTAVAYLRDSSKGQIHLVGLYKAGPWCLLARGLAGDAVARTFSDANGFSFRNVMGVDDEMYLPGALRYADMAALAALAAPGELTLNKFGLPELSWLNEAYRAAGLPEGSRWQVSVPAPSAIVGWLARPAR